MAIVSKGDAILFDFTLRDSSGAVYDTTRSLDAKAGGVSAKESGLRPVLVVAGEGQLLPGLDEKVVGSTEGADVHVVLAADKAFGARQENLVRVMPLGEFTKRDLQPFPGMVVEIDNQKARVQSVNGGRVRVDFNHELAGQSLTYDFKVVKILKTDADKIDALASDLFALPAAQSGPNAPAQRESVGKITTAIDGGTVKLNVPADFPKDANYALAKMRFAEQTFRLVPSAKTLKVDEVYARPADNA